MGYHDALLATESIEKERNKENRCSSLHAPCAEGDDEPGSECIIVVRVGECSGPHVCDAVANGEEEQT